MVAALYIQRRHLRFLCKLSVIGCIGSVRAPEREREKWAPFFSVFLPKPSYHVYRLSRPHRSASFALQLHTVACHRHCVSRSLAWQCNAVQQEKGGRQLRTLPAQQNSWHRSKQRDPPPTTLLQSPKTALGQTWMWSPRVRVSRALLDRAIRVSGPLTAAAGAYYCLLQHASRAFVSAGYACSDPRPWPAQPLTRAGCLEKQTRQLAWGQYSYNGSS